MAGGSVEADGPATPQWLFDLLSDVAVIKFKLYRDEAPPAPKKPKPVEVKIKVFINNKVVKEHPQISGLFAKRDADAMAVLKDPGTNRDRTEHTNA